MNQPSTNQPNRRSRKRARGGGQSPRNRRSKPTTPTDIWGATPELPPVEPIVIPNGVDALVRSLGDGPAIGGSTVLDRYVVAVVERSAAVAAALAFSADLLASADQ